MLRFCEGHMNYDGADDTPDTWEYNGHTMWEDDANNINTVLQAAKAYVAAVRSGSNPDNWPVLLDVLADAVEEL